MYVTITQSWLKNDYTLYMTELTIHKLCDFLSFPKVFSISHYITDQ